jgi:hypothetical protein
MNSRPFPPLLRLAGLGLSALLVLASCGLGRMGTAVVVWAPEGGTVKNGDLVWVWEQSRIRKTFKIERPEGGGSFEVDQWRVKSFPGESEAKAFQAAFLPLKDTWAVSGKQGLPVREAADANSNRIYKLGDTEEVKVLSTSGTKVKQGNLEGMWDQILTQDGYSGWVFDYYLTLVTKTGGNTQQVKASGSGDQLVQTVLAQSWFPDEMRNMVEQDRINLAVFRPDAGLRAVSSPASFLLVLPGTEGPDERIELPVQDAQKLSDSTYNFGGPNQVKVQFTNAEGSKMILSFVWQGKARSVPLTLLDENVGTLVSRELASRQQKLNEILGRGHTLKSPTYGTLKIAADGTFTWDGYQTVFPDVTTGEGKLSFDWFKDKRLFNEFRALRLQFGADQGGVSKVFLYRFLKDGFQMLPAAPGDLDPVKQTVVNESKSGLSLFFTFQD